MIVVYWAEAVLVIVATVMVEALDGEETAKLHAELNTVAGYCVRIAGVDRARLAFVAAALVTVNVTVLPAGVTVLIAVADETGTLYSSRLEQNVCRDACEVMVELAWWIAPTLFAAPGSVELL